jgi:2,3-bisphosphoglycerate-independent phosphoglycerate mutase
MSLLGYDPTVHLPQRGAIEARGMGVAIDEGDAVFRCNLVAIRDGRMWDYSGGHIGTEEAKPLVAALNDRLGNDQVHIYPGVSYRHLCKLKGREDTLLATCTPPHDIPGKPIKEFLPNGPGSDILRDLMARSEAALQDHPVNVSRRARGEKPANMIWLFWGSGKGTGIPAFDQIYGLKAAVTSGVDLLRGLALMMGMGVLSIAGVTDGLDNDYAAQAEGALEALKKHDLVIIHVEAPDEAAHVGSIDDKIEAIQRTDGEVVSRLRSWREDRLRLMVVPDHPTPIKIKTHIGEPVPFLLWGAGFTGNGARRFTEVEAAKTGLFIDPGYNIMSQLIPRG